MTHMFKLIRRELYQHHLDYLMLVTGGALCLVALSFFAGERLKSILTLIIFSCFYIIWGVYHHSKNRTIHIKNVIEYIIFSFIGLTLLILLIAR